MILLQVALLMIATVLTYGAPPSTPFEASTATPPLPPSTSGPSCRDLAHALADVFWNYLVERNISWSVDQARYELIKTTGVDFLDESNIGTFACKLASVRSLHELADILPISYDDVYVMYDEALVIIEMMGGINGFQTHLKVMSEIVKAASGVGFANPPMPLMVTEEEVTRFLHHMVTEYGPDFLSSVTFNQERIIITNVRKLAKDITNATDLDDLAKRTGFPPHVIRRIWERIGYEAQAATGNEADGRSQRANHSLLHFLKVADKYGLLDLQS